MKINERAPFADPVAEKLFPTRTLHFPEHLEIGTLELRPYASGHWMRRSSVVARSAAVGTVQVPAGALVVLRVNYDTSDDLSRLDSLRPNDIQGLDLSLATRADNEQMKHVSRLTGLRYLLLKDTDIGDDGLKYIEPLLKLQSLVLNRSEVTNKGFAHLRRLTDIEQLHAASNTYDCAAIMQLRQLSKLADVSMGSTNVGDDCMSELAKHTMLKYLDLHNTHVTDAGVKNLLPLQHLQILTLDSCNITNASIPVLTSFKELRRLSIESTKIDSKGLSELQQRCPNMHIDSGKRLPKFITPEDEQEMLNQLKP